MIKVYYIFFIAIPLSLLFLAGLFLETDKTISHLERRVLTEKPFNIFQDPEKSEKYISDHIPYRNKLLSFYFSLGLDFDFGTQTIFIGKDKWLFQKVNPVHANLPTIKSYQNKILFTKDQERQIINNLIEINKLCLDNNIKLYIMFPPDKHRVYSRYMPSYIIRDNRPSPIKQVLKNLPHNSSLKIIPLEDMLIEASKSSDELLYYKQDSHWAEEGAFLSYQELMKEIQKDFQNIKILSKNQFIIKNKTKIYTPYTYYSKKHYFDKGNLLLPNMKGYENQTYKHYSYHDEQAIAVNNHKSPLITKYDKGNPLNVYLIGDSYATYFIPFLSATFQHLHFYRFNQPGEPWGILFHDRLKEMKQEKTNILILSVSDLKLKDLLEPF